MSATFWESFVLGVRGFTGAGITEVEIMGSEPFTAYGRQYAEVEATSPRGDLTVVAIEGPDGRWHVDLLATFGQGFAPLFNQWVERLPADRPPRSGLWPSSARHYKWRGTERSPPEMRKPVLSSKRFSTG